jgi:hypothetical protein
MNTKKILQKNIVIFITSILLLFFFNFNVFQEPKVILLMKGLIISLAVLTFASFIIIPISNKRQSNRGL